MTNHYDLAMLGFGNVGRALARLLVAKQEFIRLRHAVTFRVVGIYTQRHGCALDPEGIELLRAVRLVERGQTLSELTQLAEPPDALAFLRTCGANLLMESTPVNYETGQPALDYLKTALEIGMHAISANKGPVVHGYEELTGLAEARQLRFLFESAVMDGAPIFSLWRETLPGAVLTGFRGILNSTTNYILTRMEAGESYAEALAHAQQIGIAETDPSGDVQGWDAAVKVAALVTVLMGRACTPAQVEREGIASVTPERIRQAKAAGQRWKLICSAGWEGNVLTTRVAPEPIDSGDPLFNVSGTSSALTFFTDVLPALTVIEGNPGPETTAFGMLADFLRVVR
ncbi:MAG: homoserine dehydrogenase [Anaerolineales bacterium]|nr:homoserine dehydrogenase [Anaerolineales bacterium]